METYSMMLQYSENLTLLVTQNINHKNSIKQAKGQLLLAELLRVNNWLLHNKDNTTQL